VEILAWPDRDRVEEDPVGAEDRFEAVVDATSRPIGCRRGGS
jgi:hypothetical protein